MHGSTGVLQVQNKTAAAGMACEALRSLNDVCDLIQISGFFAHILREDSKVVDAACRRLVFGPDSML